jgi:hypothetical protein
MSDNLNEDLQKMEALSEVIDTGESMSAEEKGMHDMKKNAPSVFMTDIRFKESMEAGDFLTEEAFMSLDADEQKGYEMVQVMDEKSKEPMGWVFRFKSDEDEAEEDEAVEEAVEEAAEEAAEEAVEEAVEEKSEDDAISEKAAALMAQMRGTNDEKPSMFLTDTRFKEMVESGELVSSEDYDGLDEDAKEAFEAVDVYEEGTGKGYGMRYRRRSPLELTSMRKGQYMDEKADDSMEDMFDSEAEALERAAALGCEGVHRAGEKFMPCASHDDWMKLSKPAEEAPAPAAPAAPAGEGMKSEEEFLCGFQRKSVTQSCEFCSGGCAPEEGLPGLADIENQVKSEYEGSEIISSGYSAGDDVFVVDVKRADGSFIEVFLTGEGEELGWLRLDESAIEGKSAEAIQVVSKSDAEATASNAISEMGIKAEVMSVTVDIFADEDVYVVELDAEEKSYDVFVSADGKVLGYDEYEYDADGSYELSEEEEIKAIEAELEIKRMYSREQREAMAESGEALPDGSFPIADEADLSNAIQAFGRASDPEAAKAHIMKRAKELKLEDMIPSDWGSGDAPAPAPKENDAEEKGLDEEILKAMEEFNSLLESDELS